MADHHDAARWLAAQILCQVNSMPNPADPSQVRFGIVIQLNTADDPNGAEFLEFFASCVDARAAGLPLPLPPDASRLVLPDGSSADSRTKRLEIDK